MIDTVYLDCNLASLTSISNSSEDFRIVTTNPLGQGFSGVEIDGRVLPLGSTFLEFPKFSPNQEHPPYRTYSPKALNDISRFSASLRSYLSRQAEIVALESYTCQLDMIDYSDFVLGDSLQILEAFDAEKISAQVATNLSISDANHPRNKSSFDPMRPLLYSAYCRELYGEYLWPELFEPVKLKIIGDNDIECLKYHRSNWLPLYWPNSIKKFIETGEDLTPYRFFRFANVNFAEWVRSLARKVPESFLIRTSVEHIERNNSSYNVFLRDGRLICCRRVVSALNINALNRLFKFTNLKYDEGNSIYLAFVDSAKIKTKVPDARFNLDKENSVYRVTPYNGCLGVEASSWHLNKLAPQARSHTLLDDLSKCMGYRFDARDLLYFREFKNARTNLSINNYMCHQDLWKFNRALGIEITGSAAGFGLGSIADQLVQGLRLAELSKEMIEA